MKKLSKKTVHLVKIGAMVLLTTIIFLSIFHLIFDNPLLLASFSSSVFVIIAVKEIKYPPFKVLVGSHLIAACVGFAISFIPLAFYPTTFQKIVFPLNGALAVAAAAVLMIFLKVPHAPAASTALSFSYNLTGAASFQTFGIVLLMILALGTIKWVWIYVINFFTTIEGGIENWKKSFIKHNQ